MNTRWRSCDYGRNENRLDSSRSCFGGSGCGNDSMVLHMEALEEERKMNLLIETYDYPCGLDYYYIQNNEIKKFGDEIFKKLNEISVEILIGGLFFGSESEIKKERGEKIFEIADCLKRYGYLIEKIFIVNDGTLAKSYMVENKQ